VSKFLRTVSTRRLLATLTGLAIAIAGGTAIAVAASSGGPKPKPKRLAQAIHDALTAQQVPGITARITFTNHLIDSTNIHGSDPILVGGEGRLWFSPSNHMLRLELPSNSGNPDAQLIFNNGSFWVYDPSSNTVYQGKAPANAAGKDSTDSKDSKGKQHGPPSIAQINTELSHLAQHLNLSGAIPTDVADQPAYTVRVTPKHDGGLLGAAELAWDAIKGVPLRIAVFARNDTTPVLELKVRQIAYGTVQRADFTVPPPAGAKVVTVQTPAAPGGHKNEKRSGKHHADVSGVAAVAKQLKFKLVAPNSLVGLPRRSVTLLDWGGSPAALVAYGQNLGGIAVIERRADTTSKPQTTSGEHHPGLNLPTVSINGTTAQELDTALGTMVRFTRNGVSYTVLGSVPAAAADAAARGL
jgi:outer membrane lipoprotein-sorting protein